jgi:hypothetical protein
VIQGATEDNWNARDAAGKPVIIYDKPNQTTPRSDAQATRRDLMIEAHEHYLSLTTEERENYRGRADHRKITIQQAIISEFLEDHTTRTRSHWDLDASVWDSGTSIWDT